MKTQSNRRNFIQRTMLMAAGLFSAKLVAAKPSPLKNVVDDMKPSNETLDTIHSLYTTHGNFSDKEVSDAEIEQIKQACIRATNASNMQTYSIVEVRDKEVMRNVCQYVGSCMLLFCIDYNRLIASAESLGLSYYPGHITACITGSINTSFAAQTAVIAARSMGIDTLTTNGIHRGNIDRHWDLLDLPQKYCIPLIAIVLGYADRKPNYKVGRLNGKEIFHQQTYQIPTKDELEKITLKYDDPELNLDLDQGQSWKEQGYDHYLEWFFKNWLSTEAKPKEQETPLLIQLKKRGFIEMM